MAKGEIELLIGPIILLILIICKIMEQLIQGSTHVLTIA